ncbi:MAG: 4'-phosphopantetheinyl transferase superfamily protein [Bacteroidota bacterium]
MLDVNSVIRDALASFPHIPSNPRTPQGQLSTWVPALPFSLSFEYELQKPLGLSDGVGLRAALGHADGAVLSAEERVRVESFGHPARRVLFTLGRTVVRTLLGDHLGYEPVDVPLVVADDGAPEVSGHALDVSLSHTLTPDALPLAFAAFAGTAVGVDVEALKPRRADLYRFLLHSDEYPLLQEWSEYHCEDPRITIVRCWAVKEAVLKAIRTGFRTSPKKVRLALVRGDAYAATAEVEGTRWRIHTTEMHGCAAAVALPL